MKVLVSAGSVFLLAIFAVSAADAPEMKEGLWSIHTQIIDNPGNKKSEGTVTLCRDHAYDKSAEALAKNMKGCTIVRESREGNKYTAETHCVVAGTTIDSKGTTVFQGDTAWHAESHSTNTPAFYGVSESTSIIDQKYIGPCPAGVQPGDRTTADGKVTHTGRGR
ncbi:MAG: DUF3617 family protein [Bryobacteraceae bacterium]|jgi:hypothetical protein